MFTSLNRFKIYIIISKDHGFSVLSRCYDVFMSIVIVASIIPLMFIEQRPVFGYIELSTTFVFIVDYLLRWWTSDLKLKKGRASYLKYPFTIPAIVDMLSILPTFIPFLPVSLRIFRLTRMVRLLKMLRLVKLIRYSEKISLFIKVLYKEREVLLAVLMLAVAYIFVTALIMFNVEPHLNPRTGTYTFNSFFDALYWATVTLTTVGYGDLCPVTAMGRFISMCSSLFGVAVIALPSGVITASYLEELRNSKLEKEKRMKRLGKTEK